MAVLSKIQDEWEMVPEAPYDVTTFGDSDSEDNLLAKQAEFLSSTAASEKADKLPKFPNISGASFSPKAICSSHESDKVVLNFADGTTLKQYHAIDEDIFKKGREFVFHLK